MTTQQQRKRWARTIQGRRKQVGWSQETLAHAAGYSVSYIQKIENAAKGTPQIIEKLLKKMGMNGDESAA